MFQASVLPPRPHRSGTETAPGNRLGLRLSTDSPDCSSRNRRLRSHPSAPQRLPSSVDDNARRCRPKARRSAPKNDSGAQEMQGHEEIDGGVLAPQGDLRVRELRGGVVLRETSRHVGCRPTRNYDLREEQ